MKIAVKSMAAELIQIAKDFELTMPNTALCECMTRLNNWIDEDAQEKLKKNLERDSSGLEDKTWSEILQDLQQTACGQ